MATYFRSSRPLRLIQIVSALIICLLAAGPIFGFAAIRPVLYSEGVYQEFCKGAQKVCIERDNKITSMFTYAVIATNFSALFATKTLDTFGPRVCGIIGSILLALGCLLLSSLPYVTGTSDFKGFHEFLDVPAAGYSLLALGGPFVFISFFQLSRSFPRHSARILASLMGACDASSGVFLVYKAAYSQNEQKYSLHDFFTLYLIVPLAIFIVEVTIMPLNSYRPIGDLMKTTVANPDFTEVDLVDDTATPLSSSEADPLLNGPENESGGQRTRSESIDNVFKDPTESSGVWGALHHKPSSFQIRTLWFSLMVVFSAVQLFLVNYFIASITSRYEWYFKFTVTNGSNPRDLADGITNFFNMILPLFGILLLPFISIILDKISTANVIGILTTFSGVISLLGISAEIPLLLAGHIRILLVVMFRPLLNAAISDYFAKVFGFHTFSTVYGIELFFIGISSYFMIPVDAYTRTKKNFDYSQVDLILFVLTLSTGSIFQIYIRHRTKYIRRQQLAEEAERAPIMQMPGGLSDDEY